MSQSDLVDRVRAVLPAGERDAEVFRAVHVTQSVEGGGDAPKFVRPEVLVGRSMPGDGWARAFSFVPLIFKVAFNAFPEPDASSDDPVVRAARQRKNAHFFGTWEGLAGQWMAALQPRCSGGVVTAFALSESHVRFVYWQKRRGGERLGDAHELGAVFPRESIAWTRRRRKDTKEFQIGFADGSWGTVLVPGDTGFLAAFPCTLSAGDAVP
ncbi:hypothetical protein ACIQU6_25965 [Streptomyces sp. NPDC090442]|uniref:hypothetical protein n=1 Tax=Streptomyces sp. NPDC090442 TaxID=3365962 RepID=UPI003821712C